MVWAFFHRDGTKLRDSSDAVPILELYNIVIIGHCLRGMSVEAAAGLQRLGEAPTGPNSAAVVDLPLHFARHLENACASRCWPAALARM